MRALGALIAIAGVLAIVAGLTADPLDGWPRALAPIGAGLVLVAAGELALAEGAHRARARERARRRPGNLFDLERERQTRRRRR